MYAFEPYAAIRLIWISFNDTCAFEPRAAIRLIWISSNEGCAFEPRTAIRLIWISSDQALTVAHASAYPVAGCISYNIIVLLRK